MPDVTKPECFVVMPFGKKPMANGRSSDFEAIYRTYFLQLNLKDATGRLLSSNFYWLSTKKPEFDWKKTNVVSTPITSYKDMTRLLDLPKIHLKATAHLRRAKDGESVQVRLKNRSAALAFQVRLVAEAGKPSEEILPVLWEDNYVSLWPGEERTVETRFPDKHSIGSHPTLKITGWNIEPEIRRQSPPSPR
jgi:exo-1,4-beta-D-glucosaminidase